MLATLKNIVQEVNSAHNALDAFNKMVVLVAKALSIECCSIYLTDVKEKNYFLAASVGFKDGALGKVKVNFNQGLVGLVAEREEPINLSNAPLHPRYCYFKATGEEKYKAFLGVPIIHHRNVVGVLVVQQQEERRFDESEEAFLVTLSAQLAGVIAHGEVISEFRQTKIKSDVRGEANLNGVGGSPGVAVGFAFVVYAPADFEKIPKKTITDVDREIKYFRSAVEKTRSEINTLSKRLKETLPPEELSLFDAYLKILSSASIGEEVESQIRQNIWAQGALKNVIKEHVRSFLAMEDEYLRERAVDIQDLGIRILRYLEQETKSVVSYPDKTILVSEEVTPAALAEVPVNKLAGIISAKGSSNSHVAILARAMSIPAVMGASPLPTGYIDGKQVIVDGYNGEVYVEPTERLLDEFINLEEEEKELYAGLSQLKNLRAETPDGRRIPLCVNTGLVADIKPAIESGAEGVGLYRTEVPFMIRDRFPGEDEQCAIYRQLLQAFAPKPVTLRTLDIGGDKALPYFPVSEENPFLGWRGIRVTLDHPEIFLVQMRAMLRASHKLNNLRVLLPMITYLSELDEALRLIHQAHSELVDEGMDLNLPPVGIMIEVPATVYQVAEFAKRCDFISVGSNDLTQYLLAVDRNNARVASMYNNFHPSVLRALDYIVKTAHRENKVVSICGEMAGDPTAVILLLAMDFDMLSMNSSTLPRVKWVIRNFTTKQAKELLNKVLQMDDAIAIKATLEEALEDAGLGGLVRAGK